MTRAVPLLSLRETLTRPGLEVATVDSQRDTTAPLDGDECCAQARRLLQRDSLDPADRVVGLLMLLYAQSLLASPDPVSTTSATSRTV